MRYVISPAAARDIELILAWTDEQFGELTRLRYEALLGRAILDVAAQPDRLGSRTRPEIADGVHSYHLWQSRNQVPKAVGRVKKPRHFLLFRLRNDAVLEIGRVLHDSMDLRQHLPDEFRAGLEP